MIIIFIIIIIIIIIIIFIDVIIIIITNRDRYFNIKMDVGEKLEKELLWLKFQLTVSKTQLLVTKRNPIKKNSRRKVVMELTLKKAYKNFKQR